jgi:hypothetical protein
MNAETVGLVGGVVITLLIFSYVFGDNVLYRWGLALVVGAVTGYTLAVTLRFVYYDWLARASSGNLLIRIVYVVPLIFALFLMAKGFKRFAPLGNVAMGFLLGVGAAVAVAGAVTGTLIPQVTATGSALSLDAGTGGLVNGLLVVVGTVLALASFSSRPLEPASRFRSLRLGLRRVGRGFVVVALATAFAGALTTALTLLVDRTWFVASFVYDLFSSLGG